MEPKLPAPDRGPEFRSAEPAPSGETGPRSSTPETGKGQSIERRDRQNEVAPRAESTQAPAGALPVPAPVVSLPTDDTTTTLPQVQDDNPVTASDNDQIEKEWVDKAKKVIAETKDDPYRREQEVGKLQADYIYKRYGRKLGSPQ